jgi:hypothetical protein
MENISAYDATIVAHDGLWWMFANVQSDPRTSSWDELSIYYSDCPISQDWHAHPANPVVSDVRRARPAGSFFRRDNILYRPSQNSSYRYGYGININRVNELTTERYSEELVTSISPTWTRAAMGVHTMSVADRFIISDALYQSGPLRRWRLLQS